ncbi:MAG: hypothetical protein P4M15_00915 [Alphaproteobacteria bacterium]|nr:hypothetical protein [Alphaproteobacteria bacterium]
MISALFRRDITSFEISNWQEMDDRASFLHKQYLSNLGATGLLVIKNSEMLDTSSEIEQAKKDYKDFLMAAMEAESVSYGAKAAALENKPVVFNDRNFDIQVSHASFRGLYIKAFVDGMRELFYLESEADQAGEKVEQYERDAIAFTFKQARRAKSELAGAGFTMDIKPDTIGTIVEDVLHLRTAPERATIARKINEVIKAGLQ